MPIQPLSSCPEFLPTVADWIYREWWQAPGNDVTIVESKLQDHLKPDSFPFTLVAVENGRPLGSCCVIAHDCDPRPNLGPWVAAVFVCAEARGRGIASQLLQSAARHAQAVGLTELYIYCDRPTLPLYEANGWKVFEDPVGGEHSLVLHRHLAAVNCSG